MLLVTAMSHRSGNRGISTTTARRRDEMAADRRGRARRAARRLFASSRLRGEKSMQVAAQEGAGMMDICQRKHGATRGRTVLVVPVGEAPVRRFTWGSRGRGASR